jgi:hypothetical protein
MQHLGKQQLLQQLQAMHMVLCQAPLQEAAAAMASRWCLCG